MELRTYAKTKEDGSVIVLCQFLYRSGDTWYIDTTDAKGRRQSHEYDSETEQKAGARQFNRILRKRGFSVTDMKEIG